MLTNISPTLSNQKLPKIGVYIVCYNEEEYIERCINSVSAADQIVVVDSFSTDSTLQILNFLKNNNPNLNSKLKIISYKHNGWHGLKNKALRAFKKNIDIVISLDPNEVICKNWKSILFSNYDPSVTLYRHKLKILVDLDKLIIKDSCRIHKPQNYYWKFPVKETLLSVNKFESTQNIKTINDFDIWKFPNTNKLQNFKKLFYQYYEGNEFEKALSLLDTQLEYHKPDEAYILYLRALIYKKKMNFPNENFQESFIKAKHYFYLASSVDISIREFFVYRAIFCHENKENIESIYCIKKALLCQTPHGGHIYNWWCWSTQFYNFAKSVLEKDSEFFEYSKLLKEENMITTKEFDASSKCDTNTKENWSN